MTTALTPRARAGRLVRQLTTLYPETRCALDYATPFQLLVATILAAQCTDVRVNKISPALFARFGDPARMAVADPGELEALVQSTNFFRNKAKNLLACAQRIVEVHDGEVPRSMDDLVQLAGVGRKTANVVLGNAFNIPGFPVDTHVTRLSQRLGLTTNTDPVRIEADLTALVPAKEWTTFSLRLIDHGRRVCHARKPACDACALVKLCPKVGVSAPSQKAS